MIVALPHPVQRGNLSTVDLEIFDPGATNADGRWTYKGEVVARIHGL